MSAQPSPSKHAAGKPEWAPMAPKYVGGAPKRRPIGFLCVWSTSGLLRFPRRAPPVVCPVKILASEAVLASHWDMDASIAYCQSTLPGSVADVRPRVEAALKEQSFGVLTEIDVAATLQAKIGESIEPYLVLGACHPGLAFQAMEITRAVGLLMPCNVVLRGQGDTVEVSFANPDAMFAALSAGEQAALVDIATEVKRCFAAANATLSG